MSAGGSRITRHREKVRADIATPHVAVGVGEPAVVTLEVTNLDTVIRSFHVSVLGLDPACVDVQPPIVDLFPGERTTVTVIVTLPPEHPAGPRTVGVEVLEPRQDAPAPGVTEFTVDVQGVPGLSVTTEPSTLEMGGAGTFVVHAVNTGNTTLELALEALDPERIIAVQFDPESNTVAPGEQALIRGTAEGARPWVGMPAVRVLEVSAQADGASALATLAVVQRPRFGRRLIAFLGLLLVVTLFAYLIKESFARVAELSAENEALVKQGLGFDDEGTTHVAPTGVSGTVSSSTGSGIDGAAVQLFDRDNPLRPLQSTVTNETGGFRFAAVSDGSYLVRTQAAGFGEVWYPEAETFEEAEVVEVADGAPVADLEIVLAGRSGLVSGTVLGADVDGALVEIQVPGDVIGGSDISGIPSVVQAMVVDATGRYVLPDLTTPATYVIVVTKTGFASAVRSVSLTPGEQRDDVDILLRRGIGRIGGSVVDTAGRPIGGVTIVATDGSSRATTRSLSGDGEDGSFELRELTTPGTYTVTFAAPGYVTETITLVLDRDQQRDDTVVVMAADQGSLSGTVRSVDGEPLGGITVSVVGAELNRVTETLSVGAVGSWFASAIPVPGTYTVTFQGTGFTPTAVSVDLGSGPEAVRRGVDAVLTPADASLRGTVTDTDGRPISGVQITLEGSDVERHTISSDEPPGAYVFDPVPPGVYTLTYRRSGSTPQTLLVDLDAGQRLELDPIQLEQQARIVGIVTRDGVGAADIGVIVYRRSTYPDQVVTSTVTGPGGTFEIVGLEAPETYIVEFQVPAGGPVVQSQVVFLQPDAEVEIEAQL